MRDRNQTVNVVIDVLYLVAKGINGGDFAATEIIAVAGLIAAMRMPFRFFDEAIGKIKGVNEGDTCGKVISLSAVAIDIIAMEGCLLHGIGLFQKSSCHIVTKFKCITMLSYSVKVILLSGVPTVIVFKDN